MAEIKIEQKKQVWPWILAGLVVVALAIYFMMDKDNVDTTAVATEENYVPDTNENNLLDVKENNSTVAAFVSFVENGTDKDSLDYAYTNEAFLKLASATNAMAEEIGIDVRADLDRVSESTLAMANEPFESSKAKNIRNATDISTESLRNIQMAKYPNLADEVEELKGASTAIDPSATTLKQKDAVKNYFEKAADLLEKMN